MKKYKTMDGNEACATIAYMFTEVAGIYPITPSSSMAELIDEWSNEGKENIFNDRVKVVEMQSEAGAAGLMHGSLQSGCLSTTFTASQGLLLMIPNMYKMAGELLPAVIHVASRSISTHALSILGDHQDIYATRMTGFAMLASSSVQQVMDLSAVSHLSTIKASVPLLHFFDGFRTSHEQQKINILKREDIIDLVDMRMINKFRKKSLSPFNRVIRGTNHNEDIYFQATEARNKDHDRVPDIVNYYMGKINEKTGCQYKPFNYYGESDATSIIVAMGSVCETIKETIEYMNNNDSKVGLIEVHLYRPFSKKYFFDVLPNTVNRIAVLDRTKEPGSSGEPLYLDVVSIFNGVAKQPLIIGGRYGLSSKDTNPVHIKAIFTFLNSDNYFNGFTVGITDDITNLSIPITDLTIDKPEVIELLIYGYGSDGMISCAKDIIKIIGDNTENKVQGYFQYDSKKSGGITRSHLRISPHEIKSTYFVNKPDIVVCSKESYLGRYDMLSNIKDDGTFLFVTALPAATVVDLLSNTIKKLLAERNIKFYIIDAYELANKWGLKNKISMIMETCLLKILNIIDFDIAYNKIKTNIIDNFSHKGANIVESNLNVVNEAIEYLREIPIDKEWLTLDDDVQSQFIKNSEFKNKVFMMMENLEGNELSVSDFESYKDGTYVSDTAQFEKRAIAENLPKWIPQNCIQCNLCSFVCPHAVIRPFLLNKDEFDTAPEPIKKEAIKAVGTDYMFQIGISTLDCTGCAVCVKICPGKKGDKALTMKPFLDISHENGVKYLLDDVKIKKEQIKSTVKGSQFQKPLLEYHGACAGCGETPYLRLLTQLFGDKMVIANATGCSSIYGSSMPSMPYNVPWASSLFEDNAEYGYGMLVAYDTLKNRIKNMMLTHINNVDQPTKELFQSWLNNTDSYDITKDVYDKLDYHKVPYLVPLKYYIPNRSIWAIGGDGWAYDIGFGGLDHVLAGNNNINILVLDTQVYSNTGGQASKASEKGSINKFTSSGKTTARKDLAKMMMTYPNVYVAQISLGANMAQTLNAFMEAEKHDGPSLIIAYSTCILQGIKKGMEYSIEQQKRAVECGYFPIFRYKAKDKKFSLDYKEPNFDLYDNFLNSENRFAMLKKINIDNAEKLLKQAKEDAIERFNYYKSIQN